MFPNEGTPTTPLMQRSQHRHSDSAALPAMGTTIQVECLGRQGQITLAADGTVQFTHEEVCQMVYPNLRVEPQRLHVNHRTEARLSVDVKTTDD